MRTPTDLVSDQVQQKTYCTVTEDSLKLEISDEKKRGIVLSIKRKQRPLFSHICRLLVFSCRDSFVLFCDAPINDLENFSYYTIRACACISAFFIYTY